MGTANTAADLKVFLQGIQHPGCVYRHAIERRLSENVAGPGFLGPSLIFLLLGPRLFYFILP